MALGKLLLYIRYGRFGDINRSEIDGINDHPVIAIYNFNGCEVYLRKLI